MGQAFPLFTALFRFYHLCRGGIHLKQSTLQPSNQLAHDRISSTYIWFATLPLFVLLLLFSPMTVHAEHTLKEQLIEVTLNHDGSADIKEKRKAHLTTGTENFIPIGNLGKSKIKNFKVRENGIPYTFVENWDVDGSRRSKMYKYGITKTDKGYELCWGIGRYGTHEYTLEYTVTNMIKQLTDSQILYWRFVNDYTNIPPKQVRIVIQGAKPFSKENEKIWAFGFKGDIRFKDGKIVAESAEPFDSGNYATVLAKFPNRMFQSADHLHKSFKEVKDQALEGSDYGKEDFSFNFFPEGLFLLIFLSIIGLFITGIIVRFRRRIPRKFKRKYLGTYFRHVPYEGSFIEAYAILNKIRISDFQRLLTAFILKWIKEGKIDVDKETIDTFFPRDEAVLQFLVQGTGAGPHEEDLYQYMLEAAGPEGTLKQRDFTNWALENQGKLTKWEYELKQYSEEKLVEAGYLARKKRKVLFITDEVIHLTAKGKAFEKQVYQFANYLHDYSRLNEQEAANVKLWDDLMIWAAMLGLVEATQKQFKKLYPDYEHHSLFSDITLLLTPSLAKDVASAGGVSAGGFGGLSSLGGGGGSFGGGSGGGTR